MRRAAIRTVALAALLLALPSGAAGQTAGKPKRPAAVPPAGPALEDRLPADSPAEVKAALRREVATLRDAKAKPADRVKAARAIGGLGTNGRPAARFLCDAMLDKAETVRTAAADALKLVDPGLHPDAVYLVVNGYNYDLFLAILEKKAMAEPLTPLVQNVLTRLAAEAANPPQANDDRAARCLEVGVPVLAAVAADDEGACKAVTSAIGNPDAGVRNAAVRAVVGMKHAKRAAAPVLALFKAEPGNIDAIRALAVLADAGNKAEVTKAINDQRYHQSPDVRREVDEALEKLKKK